MRRLGAVLRCILQLEAQWFLVVADPHGIAGFLSDI
jgi:hypothetical protein